MIMRKILVTGATGFIGQYVIAELLHRGERVVASSAGREKASRFSWFNAVEYIELDFLMLDMGKDYYNFFGKPDIVIHLAWEQLPNYKSLFLYESNLPRHYAFLKNLIQNGCRDLTVAGTCFEYGMREGELTETDPSEPANPYALAKDCLNKFLEELRKKEGFFFKWIRLFYLYGRGQHPGSLFSQLEMALANDETVFNMSGGQQVRDFLPVELAAKYIVSIALQKEVTGTVNCCSGRPVTVEEMVKTYLEKKAKTIQLNLGYYGYPDYEPMKFWGNAKKLQSILNE